MVSIIIKLIFKLHYSIKPGYFKLIGKNPSFVLTENAEDQTEFLVSISTLDADQIKQISTKQLEDVLFNESNSEKNIVNNRNEENLMFNNLLMKQVNEDFKKYREKCKNYYHRFRLPR